MRSVNSSFVPNSSSKLKLGQITRFVTPLSQIICTYYVCIGIKRNSHLPLNGPHSLHIENTPVHVHSTRAILTEIKHTLVCTCLVYFVYGFNLNFEQPTFVLLLIDLMFCVAIGNVPAYDILCTWRWANVGFWLN